MKGSAIVGLFSQVIDDFPYPIVLFSQSGNLIMANKMLLKEAKIGLSDISTGKINMISRITTENYPILEAIEDIFLGETTVLSNLVNLFSIFASDDDLISEAGYQSAIFFPITHGSGHITYGGAMFMK